jgi:hypothetical protein
MAAPKNNAPRIGFNAKNSPFSICKPKIIFNLPIGVTLYGHPLNKRWSPEILKKINIL